MVRLALEEIKSPIGRQYKGVQRFLEPMAVWLYPEHAKAAQRPELQSEWVLHTSYAERYLLSPWLDMVNLTDA
ncbi:hypothetical protein CYMTET_44018 [Cymbomonas tetramitiformis]|uniref:Uncharacterized protein n=2 Tax=Cymbomonas tetramitiformis TaxID=36881 RepID=A0AAE0EZZ6_9CHLO|nr:hypothetical protein CYMTET_44018 [Cymbomonas tetramitiformis]